MHWDDVAQTLMSQSSTPDYGSIDSRDLDQSPHLPKDSEADVVRHFEHVYIRRESVCSWFPDVLLCCFTKARVTNATLGVEQQSLPRRKRRLSFVEEGKGALRMEVGSDFGVFRLVFLCMLCVVAGVGNQVCFVQMGTAMSLSPAFLLYFTTLLYVFIYFAWLAIRMSKKGEFLASVRELKGAMGKWYLLASLLVAFGGVASQYSDPHVSGARQALINQITLPLTALGACVFFGQRFAPVEIIGGLIVLLGSLLPVLPPFLLDESYVNPHTHQISDTPFWLLIFFLSDIPSAACNLLQEIVFREPYLADEIHYLAFTNLLSGLTFLLVIPLDKVSAVNIPGLENMSALEIQVAAFQCLFEIEPLPPGCQPKAWIPVLGFVGFVVVYFFLLAVVVKNESAAFQALVNTMVTPLSAVAFSSTMIMGDEAQELSILTVVACVLIPCGIVVFKWADFSLQTDADILPLIARH